MPLHSPPMVGEGRVRSRRVGVATGAPGRRSSKRPVREPLWGNKSMPTIKMAFAVLAIVLGTSGRPIAVFAQQEIDFPRVIETAEMQEIMTQRMANEALLVALGVDPEINLDRLASSRAVFGRALVGLRDGDRNLGLPVADAEVRDGVDRALGMWERLDEALRTSIESGQVTTEQVATIAGISGQLLDAMMATTDVYEKRAPGSEHFSMLVAALKTCTRQRLLSQRMTKEYLLVAYGFDPELHREQLRQSVVEFDKALDGLINGDLELALLPAPTSEVKRKLLEVLGLWEGELRPLLSSAADGEGVSVDEINKVTRVNMQLMEEMGIAEALYEAL
ncbi:MAG: hypothetical protein HKM95_04675 [Inquilinus sp.]|nr:hypothetical protein [Inquilinus sp.]